MVQILVIVGHAFVGWVLCGATMMLGMKATSVQRAIVIHAVAAPLIFAVLAWIYFRWFGYTGPLATAGIFVGLVIVLDLAVVAPFIEKSFAMFRSFSGTWLPFVLMFLVTWVIGIVSTP